MKHAQNNRPVTRGEGQTAWRQIADSLAGDIAAGRIELGRKMPSEACMAERFQVNRHTVRRALSTLQEWGLVTTLKGSGTFVVPQPPPLAYPIGLRTRFSDIAMQAGREPVGKLLSSSTVMATSEQAKALQMSEGERLLHLVTLHKADCMPITLSDTFLPLPRFDGLDATYRKYRSLTRAFAEFGIEDYTRLSTRISARRVHAEEAELLGLTLDRVVLIVSSINVDVSGIPIQKSLTRFAADRVELVVNP